MSSTALRGYLADGTIAVSRFVSHDGAKDHRVVQAAGTAPIVGVSHEGGKYTPIPSVTTDPPVAAEADDPIMVYPPTMTALVRVGTGGVTAGGLVKSDATGQAIAATPAAGDFIGGRAEQSGAAGSLVLVYIFPQVVHDDAA